MTSSRQLREIEEDDDEEEEELRPKPRGKRVGSITYIRTGCYFTKVFISLWLIVGAQFISESMFLFSALVQWTHAITLCAVCQ